MLALDEGKASALALSARPRCAGGSVALNTRSNFNKAPRAVVARHARSPRTLAATRSGAAAA
jgi:hypothetical protein